MIIKNVEDILYVVDLYNNYYYIYLEIIFFYKKYIIFIYTLINIFTYT
jgi:hypothetical protein